MQLSGSTALITGAAHRLGAAIAIGLAEAGANVVVNYRSSATAANRVVNDARALGVDAIAARADVSDPRMAETMLRRIRARMGEIDLLVANAGAFRRTPLLTASVSDWNEMLRSNLDTCFVTCLTVGRAMRDRGRGCIVAMADVAAVRPWAEYAPYSVAKAGVLGLVRALAVELSPQVRVNAVAPGPILTPADGDDAAYQREVRRTLLRRGGASGDIVDAVLFLACSDYVTGTLLPVDGGRLYTPASS